MEPHLEFTTSYLMAFIMGLFSSMHCIGMCGSIIGTLTLSLDQKIRTNKAKLFWFVLNYNVGRILSYTLAGTIGGFLAAFIIQPFGNYLGYRALQLISALVIFCSGLYIAGWFPRFAYIEKIGVTLWKRVEPFGRKLIPVKTRVNALLFGMIWGWLPCGLVYTSLALAISTGDTVRSALTMLAFGFGTLPAVLGVGIIAQISINSLRRPYVKQIIGLLMILLALAAAFPWFYPMRIQHH